MARRRKRAKRRQRTFVKGLKDLRKRLRHYRYLFDRNEREGYPVESYQRINEPIPSKVDMHNLSWDYLKACVSEEEQIRNLVRERNRKIQKADIEMRKTYKTFDKEASAREEVVRERLREEEKLSNISLHNSLHLFNMDAFGQDMVDLGVDVAYVEFDMWANTREINEHGYIGRMQRMRKNLDGRLKDFSAEVMKD